MRYVEEELEREVTRVSEVHFGLSETWRDMQETVTEEFARIHDLLLRRETELLETIKEAVLPLTSRLVAISSDLNTSLLTTKTAIINIEKVPANLYIPSDFAPVRIRRLELPTGREIGELVMDNREVVQAICRFGRLECD